jgi:hypothetical protein
MRSPAHPIFSNADVEVMRALSRRDVRWMTLEQVVAAVGWDPNHSADTTRALAALAWLKRSGYIAWCRPQIRDRPVFALTERGAAEIAALDQLSLAS